MIVQPNATQKLSRARMTGDTTYDPTSAIKVFYSQVSRPEGLPSQISSPLTNPALSNTSPE